MFMEWCVQGAKHERARNSWASISSMIDPKKEAREALTAKRIIQAAKMIRPSFRNGDMDGR
jgi:hypothetical protein